ncbi:MAG: hypothetical protein RR306_02445 [Clostridia bacterium]
MKIRLLYSTPFGNVFGGSGCDELLELLDELLELEELLEELLLELLELLDELLLEELPSFEGFLFCSSLLVVPLEGLFPLELASETVLEEENGFLVNKPLLASFDVVSEELLSGFSLDVVSELPNAPSKISDELLCSLLSIFEVAGFLQEVGIIISEISSKTEIIFFIIFIFSFCQLKVLKLNKTRNQLAHF